MENQLEVDRYDFEQTKFSPDPALGEFKVFKVLNVRDDCGHIIGVENQELFSISALGRSRLETMRNFLYGNAFIYDADYSPDDLTQWNKVLGFKKLEDY